MELSKKIEGFLDVMDRPSIYTLVEWLNRARKLEAENERLREALHQEGHIVIFTDDSWSIQHPIECRPDMTKCEIHQAMNNLNFEFPGIGEYKVVMTDVGLQFDALKAGDE